MGERLQKLLARAGLGSRREIETWIAAGLVTINGKVSSLGDRADIKDEIKVRGRRVKISPKLRTRVLLYHKPVGEVTTRKDPQARPTVFARLPLLNSGRWIAVGRLDINTSGLLLFTNDGKLANALMHPSSALEREYAVRVRGEVNEEIIKRLTEGVALEDGWAHFHSVRDGGGRGSNHWYNVVLTEGRNREVKRLWQSQGITVNRLIRIRYGPILLGSETKSGRWRELQPVEMKALYASAGIKPPHPQPHQKRKTSRYAHRRSEKRS